MWAPSPSLRFTLHSSRAGDVPPPLLLPTAEACAHGNSQITSLDRAPIPSYSAPCQSPDHAACLPACLPACWGAISPCVPTHPPPSKASGRCFCFAPLLGSCRPRRSQVRWRGRCRVLQTCRARSFLSACYCAIVHGHVRTSWPDGPVPAIPDPGASVFWPTPLLGDWDDGNTASAPRVVGDAAYALQAQCHRWQSQPSASLAGVCVEQRNASGEA
jgi:hypothetical protein